MRVPPNLQRVGADLRRRCVRGLEAPPTALAAFLDLTQPGWSRERDPLVPQIARRRTMCRGLA